MSFLNATCGALARLVAVSGSIWLIACFAVVLAGACESAKPKGDSIERGALSFIGAVAALAAPFLLLVHGAFAVVPRPPADGEPGIVNALSLTPHEMLAALGVVAAALLFAPSLIGWAVGRTSPSAGGALFRASPLLNAAALALAVYAAYRSVALVLKWATSGVVT
jgi:hypothetical protein